MDLSDEDIIASAKPLIIDQNPPEENWWSKLDIKAFTNKKTTIADLEKIIIRTQNNVNKVGQGMTPLGYAVKSGRIQNAEFFIINGANVNTIISDTEGKCALSYACSHKNEEMVDLLLANNAKLYIPDQNHKFPIHYCNKMFARKLINFDEEIKPKTKNILDAAKENLTKEVLHWIINGNDINTMKHDMSVLDYCALNGNLYLVHLLINLGATIRDDFVHHAVKNNHVNVLKLLVQMNINPDLQKPNPKGNHTPLMLAITENKLECADFLIHRTSWMNYFSKDKLDAFLMSIKYDRREIVEIFVRDFNLLQSNIDGMNLLMYSARWDAINCMKKFVENFSKELPATVAAKYGRIKALEYLLSLGVSVNTTNSDNEPLITLAIKHKHDRTVNFLIDANCDLTILSKSNESPFTAAVQNKTYDILSSLLSKVDSPVLFNLRRSALYQALFDDNTKAAELIIKSLENNNEIPNDKLLEKSKSKEMKMVILGIKTEKDVKMKSKSIHLAASKNDLISVKYFLLQDSNCLDSLDANKKTPLMYAAEHNSVDVLNALIFYGANISVEMQNGADALSFAAQNDNIECFTILHKIGVPINELRTDNATPLCIAAKHGSIDVLNYIISQGVNPLSRVNPADFPIVYAVLNGKLQIVQHLIEECGCDMNLKNKDEIPILYLSVNQENVFKYLIEKGADKEQKDKIGGTLSHHAAKANNLIPLKYCVENGISLTTPRDSDGFISLHVACLEGLLPNIEFIIKNNVGINTPAANKILPMHLVLQSKNLKAINFVIKSEGNLYPPDSFGLTPLLYCCKFGIYEIFKKLIDEGVSFDLKDVNGYDAFYLACYGGNIKIVKVLFKRNKKLNLEQTYLHNYTYLHAACEQGNLDVVSFLISKKASLKSRTDDRSLPIHLAAKNNNLKVVEFLVKKNGSRDQLLNEKGPNDNKCLQIALLNNALDVAIYCIEKGADIYGTNSSNLPIMHQAAYEGDITLMRRILNLKQFDINNIFNFETPLTISIIGEKYDMARFLINHNAKKYVNGTCRPLHRAVYENRIESVKKIIELGFSPNEYSDDRMTPFMIALKDNNPIMINYFMTLDLDIHTTDYEGATALCYAIKLKYTSIVKEMIDRGYSISFRYADLTPLNASIRYDAPEIFKLLITRGANTSLSAQNGFYPEMEAAVSPNIFYLQYMSQNKDKFNFDVNSPRDITTPLIHAMLSDQKENFKFLLNCGVNVNNCSMDKMTPIYIAILNCKWDYAEMLHEKDSSSIKIANSFNFKPLKYCTRYQRLYGLEFCLKHGENINQYIDNIPLVFYGVNKSGWKAAEKIRQLGADITADGILKQSLLHHVAKYYYLNDIVSFAEILLDEGLNVNYRDEDGNTPMSYTEWVLNSQKGNTRYLALPKLFKQKGGGDTKVQREIDRDIKEITVNLEVRDKLNKERAEVKRKEDFAYDLRKMYEKQYEKEYKDYQNQVEHYNEKVRKWNDNIDDGNTMFYGWHEVAQSYRRSNMDSTFQSAQSSYNSYRSYDHEYYRLSAIREQYDNAINECNTKITDLTNDINRKKTYWENL